jgi:hypothetical protein
MMMQVERGLFPNLAEYLSQIDEDLELHPHCRTKLDFFMELLNAASSNPRWKQLPEALRSKMSSCRKDEWVSEVFAVVCLLAIRDVSFASDGLFLAKITAVLHDHYQRPGYKIMFALMKPSIMLIAGVKRWQSFHVGTELKTVDISGETHKKVHMKLSHPPDLWPLLVRRAIGTSLVAALKASGAKNTIFDVLKFTAGETLFLLEWDA